MNCIDLGDGQLYPQLQTCPMGRSCRDDTGFCENEGQYECTNPEADRIRCNVEGYFPDPFTCNKYFICVLRQDGGFDKHLRECKESHTYDPFTKQCKPSKNETRCNSPVSICNNNTQTAMVSGNPNLFYRCMRENVTVGYNYLPQMYACPNSFYFNVTTCQDPDQTGLDSNNTCVKLGNFVDVTDCNYYNVCKEIGVSPVRTYCGSYSKFIPWLNKCKIFNCEYCRG